MLHSSLSASSDLLPAPVAEIEVGPLNSGVLYNDRRRWKGKGSNAWPGLLVAHGDTECSTSRTVLSVLFLLGGRCDPVVGGDADF